MALWDLENADCVLVMGSNMAENHPIAFRFVVEAQRRGGKVIHVDPRFTRTSALADIHAHMRSGSDIAFLGGLIRYVLEHDLWFKEFALAYTNIATIIDEGYEDPTVLDGVFSGFNKDAGSYTDDTWQPEGKVESSASGNVEPPLEHPPEGPPFESMTKGPLPEDPTLQHPNCVYQILKRHYAAYTPEMVERVCGVPQATFERIARTLAENSGRERTTAICYAVGWTHQTVGVQIIRAAAMLQGLMGNIGRPGGGIMALRGHVSIQGSTDIPTLYHSLPGYLSQPKADAKHKDLKSYLEHETPATGWWANTPKYVVSLLKAWYGEAAIKENDWAYDNLPKLLGDSSQEPITLSLANGLIKGQFIFGQNPLVGAVNTRLIEQGMAKLEWLVVRDFAMTETGDFWRDGRRVRAGEVKPEEIGTEVFFFPAAMPGEKEGSVTNTSRLVQWHDAVAEAPGDSRSDLWFVYWQGRRLKELYAGSVDVRDKAVNDLTWDYPVKGDDARGEIEAEAVLREINGWTTADKTQVEKFQDLKDDGSTAAGCWIYTGIYPAEGKNLTQGKRPDQPGETTGHRGWAFSWPVNRRTMYNRASADPDGKPWSERKKMIWWDEDAAKWTGHDVPDYIPDKRPDMRPDWSKDPRGMDALGGDRPFIMEADGRVQIFSSSGLKDGPLPTHYEPVESPVRNALHPQRPFNPTAYLWGRPGNELHAPEDPRFPYVFTTYRLTELHCGGIPTRIMPHTAELQPEAFVEVSPELAAELGIENTGWTVISSLRGEIEVKALVTPRMRPFTIDGRTVHQIGMPWVFGPKGYARGEPANVLLAIYGDANTSIHTTKAVTVNLRAGRLGDGSGEPSAPQAAVAAE
ncbi:MAG: molybdopterin-dependent oxidoreductase [Caulobacteraceae bacterium]|nr:molybdopterin-dependent oxidoreductase [Caulobacter sp.]